MALLMGSPDGLELTLLSKIKDTLNGVPIIADWVNVHPRERFPDSSIGQSQVALKTDPINVEMKFVSIIQIGVPSVRESNYTTDRQTQLDLIYPITFDLAVHDTWNTSTIIWSGDPLEFSDSRTLAMMVYMRARKAFKDDRTFGYDNVEHDLLQQDSAQVVEDEDSKTMIHAIDWSLTVHVKGTTS